MKRRKMMLLLLVGFVPFLLGFRFGGEIKYGQPVRFQHDPEGRNFYRGIAAGDVNGDGAIDLIVIRNNDQLTTYLPYLTHEVRIYKNKGTSLPIQDMFAKGTHQGGLGDADPDSVQIYKEEALYTAPLPGSPQYIYGPKKLAPGELGGAFYKFDAKTWVKAPFQIMAVTYTMKNSKKVVDSIYVSVAYPDGRIYLGYAGLAGFNFCNGSSYLYAGKVLQLKNPYVHKAGGVPNDAFGLWIRVEVEDATPTVANDVPGDVDNVDGLDEDAEAVGFDYRSRTYVLSTGLCCQHDAWKSTYHAMAAGDFRGNGTYDLILAPLRVLRWQQGDTPILQGMSARIYRLTPTRYRGDLGSDLIWADCMNQGQTCINYQIAFMQAVDMDRDGKDDLLFAHGGIPTWLPSKGSTFANQNSYTGRLNPPPVSMCNVWADNLRLKTNTTSAERPENNKNGCPDLVSTSGCKVLVSYYASDKNRTPSYETYSEWNTVYDGTPEKVWGDPWVQNLGFNNVIIADIDSDGENEIIVTTGRTCQFWIFKKSTAKYLTMLR